VLTTVSSATLSFGVMDNATAKVRQIQVDEANRGRVVVGQSLHGAGIPEFTTVVAIRLGMGQDDHVVLSAPRAGLSDQTFALLAGNLLLAQRTAASNRFNGNGQYGIEVRESGSETRITANYFGMLGELATSNAIRLGPIRFPGDPPVEYVPGTFDRVDRRSNKYGLALDPGTNPGGNPPQPPGGGNGLDPLPPRDPIL